MYNYQGCYSMNKKNLPELPKTTLRQPELIVIFILSQKIYKKC